MSILAAALIWAGVVIVSMIVASFLAARWGREPFGWALLSAVLGPIAIIGLVGTRQTDLLKSDRFEPVSGVRSDAPTIVAATDGSAASERVVRYIAQMHRTGSDVLLLAVLPQDARARASATQEAEHARAVNALTGAAKAILDEAGIPHRIVVGYGNAGEEIVRCAEHERADAIVVGRRGAGLSKALLGSVSDHVVKHATRPVVVVD